MIAGRFFGRGVAGARGDAGRRPGLLQQPAGILGVVLLGSVAAFTILGNVLYDGDPFRTNASAIFASPSARFPLGADQLGRDVLARMLSAGLLSIPMGIAAIGVGAVIGSALGLVSGFVGGLFDTLLMRVVDVMLSFPTLLIALVVVSILGPSVVTSIFAVSLAAVASYARVVRSTALALRSATYIEAARVSSTRTPKLITRHVVRNVLDVVVPLLVIGMGNGMIVLAALSFLGIGVQPPQADWGVMLTDGVRSIYSAPLVALAPAIVLYLTVAGINLTGEALGVSFGAGGRVRAERP
jgi:peptide/nickel transport system permease protein